MSAGVVRIAIFGPESTGKSMLAEALAAHFDEPWAPEYVRAFWEERAGRIAAVDLDAIARGQIAAEEAAAARARRVVFCDTELLTNVLYADLLFPGGCPAWVRAEAEVRARRYAVYLRCESDLPWADDPQRCFPATEDRGRMREHWRAALASRDLPHVTIAGLGAERLARAVAAVEAVLARGERG